MLKGQYIVVDHACIEKLTLCLQNKEIFDEFAHDLIEMIDEVQFASVLSQRNPDDKQFQVALLLKQMFVFGVFCRQNIELIQELIKSIDYRVVSHEEFQKRVDSKEGLDV